MESRESTSVPMSASQKRAVEWYAYAAVAAFVSFWGLFAPGIDRWLAGGAFVGGLAGFFWCFNKAFSLWGEG